MCMYSGVVFENFYFSSPGRSNGLEVTSEDTDVVEVKRLLTSLPSLNESSFVKEYSWGNRIATRLFVQVHFACFCNKASIAWSRAKMIPLFAIRAL